MRDWFFRLMAQTIYATCFWFVRPQNRPDWLLKIQLEERERIDDSVGDDF